MADARAVDTQLHLVLHRLTLVDLQTMLLVHAVLIAACTALALARRRWTAAAAWLAVAVCSVAWLAVDQHWEGRILYRLGGTHGVTEADLVVPAAIAVALLVRGLRRLGRASARRRGERREAGVPSVFRTMWPKYD